MPYGLGKTTKVAVFVPIHLKEEALKAGADVIGDATLLAKVIKYTKNFGIYKYIYIYNRLKKAKLNLIDVLLHRIKQIYWNLMPEY